MKKDWLAADNWTLFRRIVSIAIMHPLWQSKHDVTLHQTAYIDCGENCSNITDGIVDE